MGKAHPARVEDEETIEKEPKFLCWFGRFDVDSVWLLLLRLSPLEPALCLHRVDNVVDDHLLHGKCLSLHLLALLQVVFICTGVVVWCGHLELWNSLALLYKAVHASDGSLILAVTAILWHHILLHLRWRSLVQLLPGSHLIVWRLHQVVLSAAGC